MDLTIKAIFTFTVLSCLFCFLAPALRLSGAKDSTVKFTLTCLFISVLGMAASVIFAIWIK